HVQGEKRRRARRKRILAVGSGDDLQLAALGYETRPAAAELPHRRFRECLLESIEASERAPDLLGDLPRWLPAAFRPHAVPVEGVVPGLLGVVEDLHFLRIADSFPDDVLERHGGLWLPRNQLIQLVHVGLVVLAVVEADGVLRNEGLESIVGPRKGRQRDRRGRRQFRLGRRHVSLLGIRMSVQRSRTTDSLLSSERFDSRYASLSHSAARPKAGP